MALTVLPSEEVRIGSRVLREVCVLGSSRRRTQSDRGRRGWIAADSSFQTSLHLLFRSLRDFRPAVMEVILFHDLLHCESEKPSHKQSVFRFGEDCGQPGMYGPPPFCKRKMRMTELVCANVFGLYWSSELLA